MEERIKLFIEISRLQTEMRLYLKDYELNLQHDNMASYNLAHIDRILTDFVLETDTDILKIHIHYLKLILEDVHKVVFDKMLGINKRSKILSELMNYYMDNARFNTINFMVKDVK